MRERLDRFFRKPLPRFFFCLGLPLAILWILVSIVFYRIIEDWTWVQATFYSVNVFMGVYVVPSKHVIERILTQIRSQRIRISDDQLKSWKMVLDLTYSIRKHVRERDSHVRIHVLSLSFLHVVQNENSKLT